MQSESAKSARKPDTVLLFLAGLLAFLGILILAGVSAPFSLQQTGNTYAYLQHQLLFGFLPGVILGFALWRLPLSLIHRWSGWAILGCFGLLALVFIPGIGANFGGATRWISIGSLTFQPSELLKLGFVIYGAALLSSKAGGTRKKGKKSEAWAAFLGILGASGVFLLLQPDLSTLAVVLFVGAVLYFTAATPLWHTLAMVGGGMGLLLFFVMTAPYRLNRLLVFLNPMLDPMGKGYQVKQALIGIGSGGITGVGLGMSFQKFGILPEPISDSIFAVFAEELGFAGALFLIVLFLAFVWRGCVLALRSKDAFPRLLSMGIVSWIGIQAFVNMGAMIGVFPLTGIPLPLIGYGGSALAAELAGLGLLLNATSTAEV